MWFAAADLGGVDALRGVIAVGPRLLHEAGQGGLLLVVPGDEQCAGRLDGDPHLLGVGGTEVVAPGHESGLE